MDLNYTPEQEAFRQEVRQFLKDNLPADIQERVQKRLRPNPIPTHTNPPAGPIDCGVWWHRDSHYA